MAPRTLAYCVPPSRVWTLPLVLAVLTATVPVVQAQPSQCSVTLPPLEIRGKHFYNSATDDYVPIRGIAYYPRPNAGPYIGNNIDFFTDSWRDVWERDVEHFKDLNVNAVRVYGVDPGGNHDDFLCALAQAGMYLMLDLTASCDGCHLVNQTAPDCYPAALKERGQYVISTFGKYSNVLAFSAGNEINYALRDLAAADAAVCQKRFMFDMRQYVAGCDSLRKIPVGVVNADIDNAIFAQYYACQDENDDELVVAEWIGLNQYRHRNYADSVDPDNLPGYEALLSDYQALALSVPVVFTEFGGTSDTFPTIDGYAGQRDFVQVQTIFSPRYQEEFSGGFVFEYSLENRHANLDFPFTDYHRNNYGVGHFAPAECDAVEVPCEYVRFPQFDTLAAQYASVAMVAEPEDLGRTGAATCPPEFPSMNSFTWPADGVGLFCPEYGCPPGGCTSSPTTTTVPPPVIQPSPAPPVAMPAPNAPVSFATFGPTTTADLTSPTSSAVSVVVAAASYRRFLVFSAGLWLLII